MKRTLLLLALMLPLVCIFLACDESTDKPCVATDSASSIMATSAQLNGTLEGLGDSSTVNVWFHVEGPTGAPIVTPGQSLTAVGWFGYSLTNLEPATTYSFYACALGSVNPDVVNGDPVTFATLGPPTVTTGDATDLPPTSPASATLHGEVVSMGSESILLLRFELGTTPGVYSENITLMVTPQSPQTFDYPIYTLNPDTTYYYRAVAEDGMHGLVGYGDEITFKTYKGKQLTLDSCHLVFEGSTVKATGTATNTGDLTLTQAQLGVTFRDASGGQVGDVIVVNTTDSLSVGDVWNWEATFHNGDTSAVDHCEASVASLWT